MLAGAPAIHMLLKKISVPYEGNALPYRVVLP